MRFLLLVLLSINLYAENNFKLLYSDIDELYKECVSEIESTQGCNDLAISNYILFYNFMNFKLNKNEKFKKNDKMGFEEKKALLIKEIDKLIASYDEIRKKSIKYDIDYSKMYNKEYLKDYEDTYTKCHDSEDYNICNQHIEKMEMQDIADYKAQILKLLPQEKQESFRQEDKEWEEYQDIYVEILNNNYESSLFDGAMWNNIQAEWYNQTFNERRAKLKSYHMSLKK